jgi:magnesium chelatase subunit D
MNTKHLYPFTAIVGQDRMRLALLLHAVDPRLGGVLIRGERGTAKSTAVRALAALLPSRPAIEGCPFGCDPTDPAQLCLECGRLVTSGLAYTTVQRPVPVVDLPIGATEDRVLGSLDLEHALQTGQRKFDAGLLARANRGILYVDEVNLLADHLVDLLLDASALGWNYIEREGISFRHPASFMLVGTMNPEEGELRPQLLDRFALAVDVTGFTDPIERAEVVRRRIAFEADPSRFIASQAPAEDDERQRLAAARALLPSVAVSDVALDLIVRICAEFAVDGMRGDIAMYRTAAAIAAYDGRTAVNADDVRLAAELALPHRRKREPFEGPALDAERLDQVMNRPELSATTPRGGAQAQADGREGLSESSSHQDGLHDGQQASITEPGAPMHLALPRTINRRASAGRRRRSGSSAGPIGAQSGVRRSDDKAMEIATIATLRAAAPHQLGRGRVAGGALNVHPDDIHRRPRRAHSSELVLFAVDASGSMGAGRRMAYAKAAGLGLLGDAYRRRDRVAVIAFQHEGASVVLPPTNNVELAEGRLRFLPSGGRTPLASGLELARATIERALTNNEAVTPIIVLVSDGKANVGLRGGGPWSSAMTQAKLIRERNWTCLVVDLDNHGVGTGLSRALAAELNGHLLPIGAAERLVH